MNSIINQFVENCTFEQIKEKCKNNNVIYRENENLYLLIGKKTEKQTDLQRECNGIILEKETNKVVCACGPGFKTPETEAEKNEIIQQGTLEYCEDGTVIRFYNYNDKWMTATSKCIDAKNSFWSSQQTFDEMFWELFSSTNLSNLDVSKTYMFILINKDNRIVIKHEINELVFICSIDTDSGETSTEFDFECTDNIRKPISIDKTFITSLSIETLYDNKKRGVLANVDGNIYKIDFSSFEIMKDIRGNVPQIRMRYLELINDSESLKGLEEYYNEYNMLFTMIRFTLEKLYKQVYYLYVQSHIKHQVKIEEGHLFYQTLRQLHGQYKKTNKAITFDDVKTKISSLDKHIIKTFLGWV